MPTTSDKSLQAQGLQSLVQKAIETFQQGRLQEARWYLLTVLAADPQHFVALHLLGVAEAQLGRPDTAVGFLETALERNPRSPDLLNNLGKVLHSLGRDTESAARCRAALDLAPGYAIAHNNLGIALSALGDREGALAAFRKALAISADYPEALNNLGAELHREKRYEEAVTALTSAVTLNPNFPEAELSLGNALAASSRYSEAMDHLERAAAGKPDLPGAQLSLGSVLNALRRYREAIPRLERAIKVASGVLEAEAQMQLGIALAALNRAEEAVACHQRALQVLPDFALAEMNLGIALVALRRHDEALQHLAQAQMLRPDEGEPALQLGLALADAQRHDEAIRQYERALELRPAYPEARIAWARSLRGLDRQDEAIALLEEVIAVSPGMASAYDALGMALEESGRIDEACRAFDEAIRLDPRRPPYYLNRVNARSFDMAGRHLADMDSLLGETGSLTDDDEIYLHFALGKSLADIGEDRAAFDHLLRGNALKRRNVPYDEERSLARLERSRQVFTPELMQRFSGQGDPSNLPIFILGMPRSGSTLVEQILASHPHVFAGGERLDFREAMREIGFEERSLRFPTDVPRMDLAQFERLGSAYVSRLRLAEKRGRPPGAEPATRITDKMPANFRFLGLIHLALPNARIIHTCRDPVDTCLSCFSILFAGSQPFAYDLGELGRYYRGYADLMDHWRQVVPPGAILDVQYEALIGNFPAEAARILDYCGLEWHDACLSFHQTERTVRTASMSQVRQPLYSNAIGRWRLDEDLLRPLLEALGGRATDRAGTPDPVGM